MQGLRHWKLDIRSFPTVYCMSNFNNQARNDNHLKLLRFSSTKRRLGFHVLFGAANWALSLYLLHGIFISLIFELAFRISPY